MNNTHDTSARIAACFLVLDGASQHWVSPVVARLRRHSRPVMKCCALAVACVTWVVGLSEAAAATLTTASFPIEILTRSTTFTDSAIPISILESSGKITKLNLTSVNLNRTGTAGGAITGPYTVTGKFGYDAADAASSIYPQGISTSGDSIGGDGVINNSFYVAQTWAAPGNAYVSLTLFNWNTKKYRWISLVEPFVSSNEVGADFREITRHGDGLVWYKNYLYVADSCFGFMVFDTTKVYELAAPNGATGYDSTAHAFHANGRKYVMPKIGHYRYTAGWTCSTGATALAGCFLNRGTTDDYLVAWGLNGNIIKWKIDKNTGLLTLDSSGIVQNAGGWKVTVGSSSLFGATIVGSNMYVALQPAHCTNPGSLYKFPVSGGTDNTATALNGCVEGMVNDPFYNQIWLHSEAAGNKVAWAIVPPN